MLSRTLERLRLWGVLLPSVFALSLALPEHPLLPTGVPQALAGAPFRPPTAPSPSWLSLFPLQVGSVLRVATDGFFAMSGSYSGLTAAEALDSIKVVVTDDSGQPVAGTVSTVEGYFVWTATEPLQVGSKLTASISTDRGSPPAGLKGTYPLEVVGPPIPLPTPTPEFQWIQMYTGVGVLVSCENAVRPDCSSPSTVMVRDGYEEAETVVNLKWSPAPTYNVLWRVRAVQSLTEPQSMLEYSEEVLASGPQLPNRALATLRIDAAATQACVLLSLIDLRTGEEVRTEACQPTQTAMYIGTNDRLNWCAAPPTEGVRELWCRARGGSAAACDGSGTAGTSASGGSGPGTSGAGGLGSGGWGGIAGQCMATAGPPGSVLTPANEASCRFGASRSAGAWWLSLVGVACVCGRRRAVRARVNSGLRHATGSARPTRD